MTKTKETDLMAIALEPADALRGRIDRQRKYLAAVQSYNGTGVHDAEIATGERDLAWLEDLLAVRNEGTA